MLLVANGLMFLSIGSQSDKLYGLSELLFATETDGLNKLFSLCQPTDV